MKKNDILQTPEWVYKPLQPFDLDPCGADGLRIADMNLLLSMNEDGLKFKWFGFVWCNPPFSEKELWIKKMIEHGNGILLLPERGSTPWFGPLADIVGSYFVMGKKINFIGGSSSNNGGTVLFPFGKEAVYRITYSGLPGHFVEVKYFNPRTQYRQKKTDIH